jgi:hypothetical protein
MLGETTMLDRRMALGLLAASAALPAFAAAPKRLKIYKIASCTCCEGWIAAMKARGYAAEVVTVVDITDIWRKSGVPDALSSCHLAFTGGYITVGHVPPADVDRLLRERPKAIGLVVPGMPLGSPGMESPSRKRESFTTLLLLKGGRTKPFAQHPGNI